MTADDENTALLAGQPGTLSNYQTTTEPANPPDENGHASATEASEAPEPAAEVQNTSSPKGFLASFAIIGPLIIGLLLAAMDGTIVISAYPSIGNDLNALQSTSWIATAYMLTLTSFQPLYGKLSDIFGRKACLIFAYTIFGIGTLLCGFARNIEELIAARAFTGLGGGGMTTVVSIIISDIVPLRSRGTWQGLLNIVFATGSASGAPLGGIIADKIGWRWAFWFQAPLAALAVFSVSATLRNTLKEDPTPFKQKMKRVDFLGAAVLVTAVFALLLGLEQGGNVSYKSPMAISLVAAFFILTTLFTLVEAKIASEPFAPLRLMYKQSLLSAYLCNFFGFGGGICAIFTVSLYYQAVQKMSAAQAGVGLLPGILGGVSGSLFGGLLMQKTGKYWWLTVVSSGMLLAGNMLVNFMTGLLTHSFVGIYIALVVQGFGNGISVTTTLISLIANVAAVDQAIVTAVSYLFRSLGTVVGISVGSALVQSTLRDTLRARLHGEDVDEIIRLVRESLEYIDKLSPEMQVVVRECYESSLHVAFWFGSAMCLCSFISSIFIKEKPLVNRK